MSLIRFPLGDPVMVGRPYDGPLLIEIDQLLEQGYCPEGWVDVELADTRLVCLIHRSRPFLAGLVEPGRLSWVPTGWRGPSAACSGWMRCRCC